MFEPPTADFDTDRDQLAQETAEYIANVLIPQSDAVHALPGVTVNYPGGERPPRDVPSIKALLLEGTYWISWMDDRVLIALRTIHAATPAETVDVPRATVLRILHAISPTCPNESEFFKLEGVILEAVQTGTDVNPASYRLNAAAVRCLHRHPAIAADADLDAEVTQLLANH